MPKNLTLESVLKPKECIFLCLYCENFYYQINKIWTVLSLWIFNHEQKLHIWLLFCQNFRLSDTECIFVPALAWLAFTAFVSAVDSILCQQWSVAFFFALSAFLMIVLYFFVHTEQKSAHHSVNPAERIQVIQWETGVNQ